MAVTLVEAAKLNRAEEVRAAVIEQFARSAGVLMVLPFEDIQGNALKYNREESLPGVGFRGVNEAYPESTGVINPVTEPLVIAGGDLDVDRFIIQTMGPQQRSSQEAMKIKSLALAVERTFFKGSMADEPREFDGLQTRITGPQLLDAGSTSGGDPLSLIALDELIDTVSNPTHLFMNRTMRRYLTAAARQGTHAFIQWTVDAFGRQIAMYNDLPIILIDNDNEDKPILGFNEPNPGGGTPASTSIYCVSLASGGLTGIQSGLMEVMDMGQLQEKPAFRTRIEWFPGLAIFHGKSVARLRGIKKAAVVA